MFDCPEKERAIECLVLTGSISRYMNKDGITDKRLTLLRRGLAACLVYRYMTKKRMAVNKGQMFGGPEDGLSSLV
jgi:hypothetical protein